MVRVMVMEKTPPQDVPEEPFSCPGLLDQDTPTAAPPVLRPPPPIPPTSALPRPPPLMRPPAGKLVPPPTGAPPRMGAPPATLPRPPPLVATTGIGGTGIGGAALRPPPPPTAARPPPSISSTSAPPAPPTTTVPPPAQVVRPPPSNPGVNHPRMTSLQKLSATHHHHHLPLHIIAAAPTPQAPMTANPPTSPSHTHTDPVFDDQDVAGPRPGGASWGPGWGAGWAALGSNLTQAMGAAVHDIQELGTSFGQVLQEMAEDAEASDAEDEKTTPAGGTATGPLSAADHAGPSNVGPSGVQTMAVEMVGPPMDPRVLEAVERLGGGQANTLEASFKVIDDGVDSLTTGAFQSLGSIFATVSKVANAAARELKDTVEEGVKDISGLHVVQAASTGIAAAPRTAGGLVQRLGQSVAYLETTLANTTIASHTTNLTSADTHPLLDCPPDQPLPFDACFRVYGGTSTLDELESLANECARAVNKRRAQLAAAVAEGGEAGVQAGEQQRVLEELSSRLPGVFDLQMPHPSDTTPPQPPTPTPTTLDRGHTIITDLRAGGLQRTHSLDAHCMQRAQALSNTATAAMRQETGEARTAQLIETGDAARATVLMVQQEAMRKVAELVSVCVERLLALARSLVAHARYGKPANDGIQWPPTADHKALALRQQARRMMEDVAALSDAYATLLRNVSRAMQQAVGGGGAVRGGADTGGAALGQKESVGEERAHGQQEDSTITNKANAILPSASQRASRASFGSVVLDDDDDTATHADKSTVMIEELAAWCVWLEETRAKGVDAARSKLLDGVRALLQVCLLGAVGN